MSSEPNNSCREHYSYYAGHQYLETCYHCTLLLDVPVTILVFYCIIKVTPHQMESMKWALFNTHFWITNLDLILTVLTVPFVFYPSASGATLGWFNYLGIEVKWQAYWCQVSMIFTGISVALLYENRQNQIYTIQYKMTRKTTKVLYYTMNHLLAIIVVSPFYFDGTDQVEMRKIVLARIPCPTIEFFNQNTYVLLKGGEVLPFYSITISSSMVGFQLFFYAFRTVYHLVFVANSQISKSTRNLQMQYLVAVSVQVSIPTIVIILPIAYSLYADRTNFYNQAYNNNAMCMTATHGFLSATSTLLIYKPYREFCRRLLNCRNVKRTSPSSVVVTDMKTT